MIRTEALSKQFDNFVAVRDRKWHYFQDTGDINAGKGPYLYDLANDPREAKNVVDKHPDVVKELKSHIEKRVKTKIA